MVEHSDRRCVLASDDFSAGSIGEGRSENARRSDAQPPVQGVLPGKIPLVEQEHRPAAGLEIAVAGNKGDGRHNDFWTGVCGDSVRAALACVLIAWAARGAKAEEGRKWVAGLPIYCFMRR